MIRDILHRIYGAAFPRWAKNALEFSLLDIETFHQPKTVALPPGKRILVLAAHPDDESIGCGGTLRKYVSAGADVCAVILTDGRLGDPGLRRLPPDDPHRHRREEELVVERKREVNAALDVLGIEHRFFLDAADGALAAEMESAASQLATIISKWRPDSVLLPFLTDRHADHFATSGCLLRAIEKIAAAWPESLHCLGYETWSPLYANAYVDISATMECKRRAITCHQSQLKFNNFLAGAEGLNRFRAVSGLIEGDYAEAFFMARLADYRRLHRRLLLRTPRQKPLK